MSVIAGKPLLTDMDEALQLPIVNLPANTRRVRVRRHHRWLRFYVRLDDGIRICAGQKTHENKIELITLGGMEARTRKI